MPFFSGQSLLLITTILNDNNNNTKKIIAPARLLWCNDCAAPLKICFYKRLFVDSVIYELFSSAVIYSFSGNLVWPHVVLIMERTSYARGASVSVLGTLTFLVYSLGSTAVLTRCNILSIHVVDLMEES